MGKWGELCSRWGSGAPRDIPIRQVGGAWAVGSASWRQPYQARYPLCAAGPAATARANRDPLKKQPLKPTGPGFPREPTTASSMAELCK